MEGCYRCAVCDGLVRHRDSHLHEGSPLCRRVAEVRRRGSSSSIRERAQRDARAIDRAVAAICRRCGVSSLTRAAYEFYRDELASALEQSCDWAAEANYEWHATNFFRSAQRHAERHIGKMQHAEWEQFATDCISFSLPLTRPDCTVVQAVCNGGGEYAAPSSGILVRDGKSTNWLYRQERQRGWNQYVFDIMEEDAPRPVLRLDLTDELAIGIKHVLLTVRRVLQDDARSGPVLALQLSELILSFL